MLLKFNPWHDQLKKKIVRDQVCKSVRIPNKIAGQSKNRDRLIAGNNSCPCFISINTFEFQVVYSQFISGSVQL